MFNNIMMSLITPAKSQKKLAGNARAKRLQMDLTQEGLSKRSGVPLRTLRKFEQEGAISLESFLKIYMVLGGLDDIVKASAPKETAFLSIDEVLDTQNTKTRQRGTRK
jgi:transcriptional regulator with XRE-family HTH domain